MKTPEERFWPKVDKSGDCWVWCGSTMPSGYGRFRARKMSMSHRFSYELANGPIPDGMEIDHMCHNRGCVRPGHLRAVTSKQNNENLGESKRGMPRGVNWDKARQKWKARVVHNRREYYLGLFADINLAEAATLEKRLELYTHNDLDRKAV